MNKHIKIPATNGNHIESIELPFYFKIFDTYLHGIHATSEGFKIMGVDTELNEIVVHNATEIYPALMPAIQKVLQLQKHYEAIAQTEFVKALDKVINNIRP